MNRSVKMELFHRCDDFDGLDNTSIKNIALRLLVYTLFECKNKKL